MRLLAVFALLLATPAWSQDLPDPLPIKRWSEGNLRVELQAQLHDQVRAFFLARGFTPQQAEQIARTGCVFRSDIGHASTDKAHPPVVIDLAEWSSRSAAGEAPIKRRIDWDKEWEAAGVTTGPRVAFRWALAPDAQTFEPGDYNWGMVTFALPPATRFDLHLRWREGDEEKTATITDLECAADGT